MLFLLVLNKCALQAISAIQYILSHVQATVRQPKKSTAELYFSSEENDMLAFGVAYHFFVCKHE